jgi:hypothetical protein
MSPEPALMEKLPVGVMTQLNSLLLKVMVVQLFVTR